MTTNELEEAIQAIERAELSDAQRERLAAAIKRSRGRPKREPTMGTIGPRYEAVITMRRLQAAGLTQEEAAYRAAQEHGASSDESVKSWAKRDGLRQMADDFLCRQQAYQIGATFDDLGPSFQLVEQTRQLLEEADRLGVDYAPGWPISRIKAAIQSARGKK